MTTSTGWPRSRARTDAYENEALFDSFVDAFGQPARRPGASAGVGDGGYAAELASEVSRGLALLPRASALLPTMRNAAHRTAEGQLRSHAVAREGRGQLEQWARSAAIGSDLAWPEFAAGSAASVLAVHALIVAAADERTTALAAREIDRAYLMISAISTMLDSVNDYQRDLATGRPRAVDWYDSADPAQPITSLARRALCTRRRSPRGALACDGHGGRDRLLHVAAGGARRARTTGRGGDHAELRALLRPTLASCAPGASRSGCGWRSRTSLQRARGRSSKAASSRALRRDNLVRGSAGSGRSAEPARHAARPAASVARRATARALRPQIASTRNATLTSTGARARPSIEEGQATGSIPSATPRRAARRSDVHRQLHVLQPQGEFTGAEPPSPTARGARKLLGP